MHRARIVPALLAAAPFFLILCEMQAANTPMDDAAYTPLKLYEGKWLVAPAAGEKEPARFENHCARTGLFFVCEQVVPGKPGALVVFLPVAKTEAGYEYHTTSLSTDASPAGDWGKLTIQGSRWVYSWDSTSDGKKIRWRNTNTFSGPDQIHFEISRSDDDQTWKTVKSGDEHRIP
jgi:hypothetical protein